MDVARDIFEKNIGVVQQIRRVESSYKELYLIETNDSKWYFLELLISEPPQNLDIQQTLYNELSSSCVYIPQRKIKSYSNLLDYTIVELSKPSTLLQQLDRIKLPDRAAIADSLIHFLECCQTIKFEGYGEIKACRKGYHMVWPDFLISSLNNLLLRIEKLDSSFQNDLLGYHHSLNDLLINNIALFQMEQSCLIFEELNVKNVFLNETNVLRFINTNKFIAGDVYFTFGELMAQTYGTWLCRYLFQQWEKMTSNDVFKVRFYAFFFSLKAFLSKIESEAQTTHLNEIALSFVPKLDLYQQLLRGDKQAFSFTDLFKCPLLTNEDFGMKQNPYVTERTIDSKKTLERILPIIGKAGITRFPEITELDKTGILAFQSVRPEAEIDEETFTVFSGRGATKEDCMVSALAEAIERFCAEKKNFSSDQILVASYNDVKKNHLVVHPFEFNAPKSINFLQEEILEWVPSINLIDGKTYYVTANTVFYPYFPDSGRSLFRYFTTGLAAGNSYIEAISHALLEVIERDASAINLLKSAKNPSVDVKSITCAEASKIIEQLKKANLNVVIRDISTPDIKVPVFSVICEELDLYDPLYVSGGYGAHLNKDIALIGALNEAALSRVSTISGAREDIKKFEKKRETPYSEYKEKYKNWFDISSKIDYQSIESFSYPTVVDDVTALCNKLLQAGFNKILVVDLTVKDLILPVVKVLVPGVERYSFNMKCIGNRGKEARKMFSNVVLG